MNDVRVRYAPSPTGHLHLGSLRTALYNWLFARHSGGAFLLRIEDTDLERSKTEYTESIIETLRWLAMEPDEEVVIQSQRKEVHLNVADRLLGEGKAYRCFCTPAELRERLGESALHEGGYTRYDEQCRERVYTDADKSKSYALRFKLPHDKQIIEFDDLIRGKVVFERDQLDDFIIVRSDRTPMYNFVVVVDDAFMRISHVLRGEDHIPNTPKQILLYEACGYSLPQFGHFSMILGPDGQRLSKRHGASSVSEYKYAGFLADALCNYLVRLGWSHGDQEIFTRDELITYFNLGSMSKKGAIFDPKKLEWVNGIYIRAYSPEKILDTIERDIEPGWKHLFKEWTEDTLLKAISLYKERDKTLKEIIDDIQNLYQGPSAGIPTETSFNKNEAVTALYAVHEVLGKLESVSYESVDQALKSLGVATGLSWPQLMKPLRIALLGKSSSPGVAPIIELLGRKETMYRIISFIECLKKGGNEALTNN
ncbi:glutamate--tRNA ligase [Candidatus Dependentiae bacterium]|nr:glutamate--tRNA ligase [Candidatus Dependentiae bacterium]